MWNKNCILLKSFSIFETSHKWNLYTRFRIGIIVIMSCLNERCTILFRPKNFSHEYPTSVRARRVRVSPSRQMCLHGSRLRTTRLANDNWNMWPCDYFCPHEGPKLKAKPPQYYYSSPHLGTKMWFIVIQKELISIAAAAIPPHSSRTAHHSCVAGAGYRFQSHRIGGGTTGGRNQRLCAAAARRRFTYVEGKGFGKASNMGECCGSAAYVEHNPRYSNTYRRDFNKKRIPPAQKEGERRRWRNPRGLVGCCTAASAKSAQHGSGRCERRWIRRHQIDFGQKASKSPGTARMIKSQKVANHREDDPLGGRSQSRERIEHRQTARKSPGPARTIKRPKGRQPQRRWSTRRKESVKRKNRASTKGEKIPGSGKKDQKA